MKNIVISIFRRAGAFLGQPRLTALAQPESLFLALAVPFGFLFIFLSAPFQAPDEYVHFYRAYAISTGQLTGTQVMLPQSVVDFSQTVSPGLAGNDQNKQSKKALVQEFSRRFEAQPEVKAAILNSAIVSPLPYVPQALGVLVGHVLHLSPILIFYLGRTANFLAWLGLTLLAIRATPIHKRLFTALALMPMTLQQAASNSPDAATIGLCFLFTAFALRIWMEAKTDIPWSEWVKAGLLLAALALCKSVYVLAAGLLAPVIFRRFRQQHAVLPFSLAVMGLGLACGAAWLAYSSHFVSVEVMNTYRLPTTAGLGFMAQHPLAAAALIWNSTMLHIGDQLREFIGVLGWLDTPLPGWVYPLYYALLVGAVVFEPHPQAFFKLTERALMALVALLTSLVMAAIFIYPEAGGGASMDTAQGRYFIPLGTLYFLPFSQRKWSLPDESPAWTVTAILHVLVLLAAARALLWRYYAI
jgi:uncharacterized membrane protein